MGKYATQQQAEAAGVRVRNVHSFILREGRLTKGQAQAISNLWPAFGIDFRAQPLGLATVFGNANPVVLEIGFGMGESLVDMAAAAPELNFIGIEVHRPGVGACLAAGNALGLSNLKVLQHDAVAVLQQMIPAASLQRVQLYFPDPWPKKRHHKRRLVQPPFTALVAEKLIPDGVLHMATDWQEYAEHMLAVMDGDTRYRNLATGADYVTRPDYRPITKFEKRGERLGHGVWDLLFARIR